MNLHKRREADDVGVLLRLFSEWLLLNRGTLNRLLRSVLAEPPSGRKMSPFMNDPLQIFRQFFRASQDDVWPTAIEWVQEKKKRKRRLAENSCLLQNDAIF